MSLTQYQVPIDLTAAQASFPLEVANVKTGRNVAATATPVVTDTFVNKVETALTVTVEQLEGDDGAGGTAPLDGRYVVTLDPTELSGGDQVLVYGTLEIGTKTYNWSKAALAVTAAQMEDDSIRVY